MANISEWIKGISVFLVISIMYYILWSFFIKTLLDTITATSPVLGALSWISFVVVYAGTAPVYLIYAVTAGAKGAETKPEWIFVAFGSWVGLGIVAMLLYSMLHIMVPALETALPDSTGLAATYSWVIAFICIVFMYLIPFWFILKGYNAVEGLDEKEGIKKVVKTIKGTIKGDEGGSE